MNTHTKKTNKEKFRELLTATLFFAFLTYIVSSVLFGDTLGIAKGINKLINGDGPRLVLQDQSHEYKANAIPEELAQTAIKYLEDNAVFNKASSEELLLLFEENDFKPTIMTISTPGTQDISFESVPSSISGYVISGSYCMPFNDLSYINSYSPEIDGISYIVFKAQWDGKNPVTAYYSIGINFDRPASFTLSTDSIAPGELLIIYADYLTKEDNVEVQCGLNVDINFYPYKDNNMIALLPVSFDVNPGSYTLSITNNDNTSSFTINVLEKDFGTTNVSINQGVIDETKTDESVEQFSTEVSKVFEDIDETLSWGSSPVWPVNQYEIITNFGVSRYINGILAPYKHSGIDIKADKGTDVLAVNSGRVVFSSYLTYTGNTVIIEHGYGLKSWYYHMDTRVVSAGDIVEAGTKIGTVGITGMSDNAHLHLNISVNDTYINPVTMLYNDVFSK